jgi:hypothetical protein
MKKNYLVLSILAIIFNSCKQEDVFNPNILESTQACQDHLTAESIFDDLGIIIQEGLQDNGQSKSYPNYNLINADTSDVYTLIIDFGSINFLYSSKLRRGKINVTYSGKYFDIYSITTGTFDNYHVNNFLVEGEIIVTNQGINSNGNMWFTVAINNASITSSSGTINWESEKVIELVKGENTYSDISDDGYKITGSASGNGINGNSFTSTITDTLISDLNCLPACIIKSGSTIVSPTGYNDRTINYGDSLCDCNIDVIIDGNTYLIVVDN